MNAINFVSRRASFIDDDSNVVATSVGNLMETELDVPHRRSHMPAVNAVDAAYSTSDPNASSSDESSSAYYSSLQNADGSLYHALNDDPAKPSGNSMPPASVYESLDGDQEPSSYYASLRNPDGSLYQSLYDDIIPKSSGLLIPRASTYTSLNGNQDVYNPLPSKGKDQSLYDVRSDYGIPGLQKKKVSPDVTPDLGSDYENLGLNTIPVKANASTYASLNGGQEVYNPLTSKSKAQSLYDVPKSLGLSISRVSPYMASLDVTLRTDGLSVQANGESALYNNVSSGYLDVTE